MNPFARSAGRELGSVSLIVVQVRWQHSFADSGSYANFIATEFCGLGFQMAGTTECCAVGEIIAAVREQPPFENVMGILPRPSAAHTPIPISGKHLCAEVVTGEENHGR